MKMSAIRFSVVYVASPIVLSWCTSASNLVHVDESISLVQRKARRLANSRSATSLGGDSRQHFFDAFGDCSSFTHLDFNQENGGSLGYPGLRFGAVAEKNGQPVDLLVTADGSYTPYDASKNGLKGNVINVNLAGNVHTDVTLKFVDSYDNPVRLSRFFITILDLDGPKHGLESAAMENAFARFYLHSKSKLTVSNEGHKTKFTSTVFGREIDNPYSSWGLTEDQKSLGVAFFFEDMTSEVKFTYSVFNATYGRNFQIAGVTDIACPA